MPRDSLEQSVDIIEKGCHLLDKNFGVDIPLQCISAGEGGTMEEGT